MAAADDTPTTSRISWNEVARRVGSAEALLALLCEKPIPARYQGLFYWPSYKVRDGAPGRIGPDWWAAARVDATTRLVIFLRPSKHRVFFVGDRAKPADSPPDRDEVLALGIDFDRDLAEALLPATAEAWQSPPPTKAPAKPKKGPKNWLKWARKEYPREQNEKMTDYIRRLHGYMEKNADNVTKVWAFGTFRVRYYEEVKAEQEAVQKGRKSPGTD